MKVNGTTQFKWIDVAHLMGTVNRKASRTYRPGISLSGKECPKSHEGDRKRPTPLFHGLDSLSLGLLALFLSISHASFAADTECGYPTGGLKNPRGAYLWQDCSTGEWNFRVTGEGPVSTYSGQVISNTNFETVEAFRLESGDSLDGRAASSMVNYSLVVSTGADGFRYKMASNASACFTLNSPVNAEVRVGVTRVPVSGSFNPSTLDSCNVSQNNETIGAAMPTVDITPKTVLVGEEQGKAEFTVKLSGASSSPVTVSYETRDRNDSNAATGDADFQVIKDALVIAAGTTTAKISAPIIDDTVVESKEWFQVYLRGATNAELGVRAGVVHILDNDTTTTDTNTTTTPAPGEYAYLNDVDKRVKQTIFAGSNPLQGMGWPRIGLADSPISQSVEQLTKYQLIASQNMNKAGKVQAVNPDVMYLRAINPVEFQLTVKDPMPFNGTGPSTSGSKVYAGHWLYKPGTRLTQSISSGATQFMVEDASKIEPGSYVVIYDAPAGSFNNAEHALIQSVNKSTNTITIKTRGYKSSNVSHGKSSIIAQHVTGAGLKANAENWMYNQSIACPLDAKGNTFGEAMVNWLSTHYRTTNTGKVVDVRVDGFYFDTDRHFLASDTNADVDNNLQEDRGLDVNGGNLWGFGLESFYADMRDTFPEMIIVGGDTGTRGFDDLNGIQWEGFPVAGSYFDPTPSYADVDARLANYGLHVRAHSTGPSLTHALNKSPTKLYPNLEPSHRTSSSEPAPTSNKAFRFSFGLALLDDGFYGQPSSGDHNDVWWDEYAVDVVAGSPTFGRAMATNPNNESKVRAHLEWMGVPLGERVRVYNETAFAPGKSLIANGDFDTNLSGWKGQNLSISSVSSTGNFVEGSKALRASQHLSYTDIRGKAQVQGPDVYLQEGVDYTLAFAVKSSEPRNILVSVGASTNQLFVVPTHWVRRVISFTAAKTGNHRIKFLLGLDNTEVWLDAVYLFEGNASVFQRDFENARVVVNATPKAKTVDLEETFRRIKGTGQDPINDGTQVQKVTIAPYDAAILVRQ